MRAVVVQSPGIIAIREVPEPVIGEYDALCEVLAAAVCSGTDNHIVEGHPYFLKDTAFPLILGHEGIGRVIAVGTKVRYLNIGDLVTRVINKLPEGSGFFLRNGAFAERALVVDWQAMKDDGLGEKLWKQHTIHRVLPSDFDPVASTMIITWRETHSFLKRMQPAAGQQILIIGSGATALSFADHARNMGIAAAVIGSRKREGAFRQAGVKAFTPYEEGHYIENLQAYGIENINLIIDAVGKSETLNQVLPLLVFSGKIGVYGLDGFLDYTIDSSKASGDFSYFSGEHYDEGSSHDEVIDFIKTDKLDLWRYLSRDHIYPLERVTDALEATRKRETFKSVIKFV